MAMDDGGMEAGAHTRMQKCTVRGSADHGINASFAMAYPFFQVPLRSDETTRYVGKQEF
jgi:hypothetical protein